MDLKNYRNHKVLMKHPLYMIENSLSYRREIKVLNANNRIDVGIGFVHFYDFNSSFFNTPPFQVVGGLSERHNLFYFPIEIIYSKSLSKNLSIECMIDGNFTPNSLLYYKSQKNFFVDFEVNIKYSINDKYSISLGSPFSIRPMLKQDVQGLLITNEWILLNYNWNKFGLNLSLSYGF